jgi:tetratricopeptide (TPR) repeat protein
MKPEIKKLVFEAMNLLSQGFPKQALECCDKIIKIDPKNSWAWITKGELLSFLGDYKDAIKCFNKVKDIKLSRHAMAGKGIALSNMEQYNKAVECFDKGSYNIYDVLSMLLADKHQRVVVGIMMDKGDSLFSDIIEKHKATDLKEKYKDLYIDSCKIINWLQVSFDEIDHGIAHYTSQESLKKLLLESADARFRLHSITLFNDPSEGRTLMDYLYGIEKHTFNDGYNVKLAGSFTFNKDHLNQYRLYGKRDGQEATGVSIVFEDSFFAVDMKAPTSGLLQLLDSGAKNAITNDESDKAALFRCIYVDPETRQVIGIGHKEDYTFYRDGRDDKKNIAEIEQEIEEYHATIKALLNLVKESMQNLRAKAKELDPAIVGELLLDLRCLTKHVAFKEEQECRIVNYRTDKEVRPNETYQQYYIDYLPIRNHVREIYFAPRCENMFVYEAELEKIGVKTHLSTHPLA